VLTLSALRHSAMSDVKKVTCKFLSVAYKQDGVKVQMSPPAVTFL